LGGLHRNEKLYKTLPTAGKVYTLQKSGGKMNHHQPRGKNPSTGPTTPTEISHA